MFSGQDTPINILNGRVNVMSNDNKFKIFKEKYMNDCSFQKTAIGHQISSTPLSDIYFSKQNIDALQLGLKNMILNKSQGKYNISRQSDIELKIVMRSIYLQYATNSRDVDIITQVKTLNKRVLDWCVPEIISNIKQQEKYMLDISTLPRPIERGILTSSKGTKQLEMYVE